MTPFRALLVPFHFTSGVFIATLSLLLSVAIHYCTSGFMWLLPAVIITSWLFKYAFVMLESIADGEVHAPVASIDMLNPPHPHMREELLAATVQMQPEFTFKSETALLPVVYELQTVGSVDLGRQLVVNFVNT